MMNFKDLDFLVEKLRELDNGKNHILITGNIKVGKSTLLDAFIKKYYKNSKIDGIMTELVITDKFRIELFRYGTDKRFIIGERVSNMKFYDDVFLKKSYEFMEDFKNNDILVFDEIGNKEGHLIDYCNKLISLFKENRIFAVLKKVGNPIVDNLDKLENYVIFDLDKFYE